MTAEQHNERPRPTRAQRLVAFGFLGAFGLTIVTVLFTGLMARSAKNRHAEPPPIAAPAAPPREEPPPIAPAEPLREEPPPARDAAESENGGPSRSEAEPGTPEPRAAHGEPKPSPEPER